MDFGGFHIGPLRFVTVRRSRWTTSSLPLGGGGGPSRLSRVYPPKIVGKKCPQLQSKSSETCSDTCLTLLGTSSITLFMIMIGLGQYFAIFDFGHLAFCVACQTKTFANYNSARWGNPKCGHAKFVISKIKIWDALTQKKPKACIEDSNARSVSNLH